MKTFKLYHKDIVKYRGVGGQKFFQGDANFLFVWFLQEGLNKSTSFWSEPFYLKMCIVYWSVFNRIVHSCENTGARELKLKIIYLIYSNFVSSNVKPPPRTNTCLPQYNRLDDGWGWQKKRISKRLLSISIKSFSNYSWLM